MLQSYNSQTCEPLPPAPRPLFGCTRTVEEVLSFVQNNTPIALTGRRGGVGKISIALTFTVSTSRKFSNERRPTRCEKFRLPHALFSCGNRSSLLLITRDDSISEG
ncbi:hypothetical protein BDM02DRAFT_2051045 [Thelephora ganbajun]|uniref:Uncharacterized protein n=1 Tax=Thelephora ganbajun TaxID=370292 RepID=A0ACB6YYN1_THEGA|nr:hypothetical protein BDM02DRAFT_2051045 [Thelephora ganbajun]